MGLKKRLQLTNRNSLLPRRASPARHSQAAPRPPPPGSTPPRQLQPQHHTATTATTWVDSSQAATAAATALTYQTNPTARVVVASRPALPPRGVELDSWPLAHSFQHHHNASSPIRLSIALSHWLTALATTIHSSFLKGTPSLGTASSPMHHEPTRQQKQQQQPRRAEAGSRYMWPHEPLPATHNTLLSAACSTATSGSGWMQT